MDNQQPSNKMEWKTVIEYDRYEVNNLGQIRHKVRQKILKGRPNKEGYLYVSFNINGQRKNFAIYRLVANAFIPNPKHKPEINHIDLDKTNNNINNLEWVDSSENKKHSYTNGNRQQPTQSKKVAQWTKDGIFVQEWNSVTEAANYYQCSIGAISNCACGRTKTSIGYVWKFVEGSTTKYSRKTQ